jgi:two-component system chemotaxis sensor kinase CheA
VLEAESLPSDLVAQFRSTSLERIERIESAWFALTQRMGTPESEAELFHDVHTLKGEARLMGFADVVLITQRFEDLLFAARHRRFRVHEDVDVVVTMAIQFIRMLLRKRAGASQGGIDLSGFLKHIDEVLAEWPRHSARPDSTVVASGRMAEAGKLGAAARQRLGIVATELFLETLTGPERPRLSRAWELLSREIAFLDNAQLMPLLRRHGASAKDLAVELGKEVDIVIDGPDIRVATEVLDAIHAALLHILRNAVDHGIETPAERSARGKPRRGNVTVRVHFDRESVLLMIQDDGAGADVERIRQRATALGLLSRDAASTADDATLLNLVFAPGFSVRESADEISGRGIGMDAVRATIERMGGSVSMTSTAGAGALVTMRLPQASKLIDVHRFPSTRAGVTLALPTSWIVRTEAAPSPIDPLSLLDIPSDGGGVPLVVSRDGTEHHLVVGGPVTRTSAVRVCPTPPEEPLEIVEIGAEHALLLRPEALFVGPKSDDGRR